MSESAAEIESGNGHGQEPSSGNGNGSPVIADGIGADRLAQPVDIEQPPRLPFAVVGIGASAGGLEAYTEFLQHTKPDSGMAFVLVQHLSPKHTSIMAEILARYTAMEVQQVEDGMMVEPNHVYVIRPGFTMTIQNGRLHLGESAADRMHRRPVDDFFRSLAEEQRERAICVILSGTGSNGTMGAQMVKTVGGICIAQDPGTAKFPSMPRSLVESNLADAILRPDEMFEAIARYASHPYSTGAEASPDAIACNERQALGDILAVLRTRTRNDFGVYKRPTLVRRIQRRMSLMQIELMSEYARVLRDNPGEISALSDDLMIHVTGFFRDVQAWESLNERVIKPMVAAKADGGTIRCWVTACSSGEEAYTLGIMLLEAAEASGKNFDIKIFATDTAERSLNHARTGIYPGGIESDIEPARMARYFEKDDSCYRIKKQLRELVVFAPQNVLQDPPFSRLDIITCRNLLIYIQGEVQRRVLSMLHFGLREGGALLLGNSEATTGAQDLFEPIDKRHRLYRRIGATRPTFGGFPVSTTSVAAQALARLGNEPGDEPRPMARPTVAQLANQALLQNHTPPSVVVDRAGQILYFHGNTEPYLAQPRGEPTRDLMALAREEVRGGVRTVLSRAMAEGARVHHRNSVMGGGEDRRRIEITAVPLGGKSAWSYYLVSFESRPDPHPAARVEEALAPEDAGELRRIRTELQVTIEELQSSNEEMKAANEEVTSINEELQSTNEELETSKEELQSLNEELSTVNTQLHAKMDELERTSNDLTSLLGSTDIAVIFLDRQLRIRRFTAAAKQLIELIVADVGRPLTDLSRKFNDPHLFTDAAAVLEKLIPIEREVAGDEGSVYVRRVLPYRTTDNRIDGLVITFIDVTQSKRAEHELAEAKAYAENIVQTLHEPLLVLEADLTVRSANPAFYREFKVVPEHTVGRKIYELGNGQWNIPALRTLLEEVLPANKVFSDYEVSHRFEEIGPRVMLLNGRQLDHDQLILLGIRDFTERDRAERVAHQSHERLRHMTSIPGVGVMIFDSDGGLIDANDTFLDMTGYTRDDIASKAMNWLTLTPPEYIPISQQQLAKLHKTGRIGPYEKEFFRKDGSRSWMLFAGATVAEGINVEFCIEVTDRKRAEETLQASKAAAEEANRIKDEFLATLSHELRTPLGAILLWTKLLLGNAITDISQVREGLSAIRTSAEAQKELIEDLLDMSRITTGNLRLRIREVELPPLIRDALDAIGPAAIAKNVTVLADIDSITGAVQLDPDRLRQILWNLLTNAVKFTPPGGQIDVTVARRDHQIEIRVSDTGQGIVPEFLPHVFERFRQADASSTRAAGGIGLGLTIVKQLVELHGGTISAESAGPDQGATFTVRLPQTKSPRRVRRLVKALPSGSDTPGAVNLAGLSVLLIEDEPKTRAAIATILRRAGMTVAEAESAPLAMELLNQSRPDLLISDIGLRGEDGYALIRRIRTHEAAGGLSPLPAIALTAFVRETDRRMALDAGFQQHLGKPLDPDQLLTAIRELLHQK